MPRDGPMWLHGRARKVKTALQVAFDPGRAAVSARQPALPAGHGRLRRAQAVRGRAARCTLQGVPRALRPVFVRDASGQNPI